MRRSNRLPLEALAPYLLAPPEGPTPLDWPQVFGNDRLVEIEVGFGKGLFLLTAAQAHAGVNFVGVEILRKYQLFTATRLAKRGLTNVRLVKADARLFLRDYVAPNSVQAVHVYFPDPWWKKRHHKRRVFTAEFARQCARVLRPGGRLLIATDVAEYFAIITELLSQLPALQALPVPEPTEPTGELDALTNFERKARQRGETVYRSAFERREAADGSR